MTVIGGGQWLSWRPLFHLSRAGLRVLCIEADVADTDPVGESLDWSAPDLLKALGLTMGYLLDQGIATYKRHVVLKLRDGSEQHYIPGEWLGKPPFNIDLRTLHVDRSQLNQAIRRIFLASGVTLIAGKVVHVETTGKAVDGVVTANGERITSRWFLDASGSAASLFPRTFKLPVYEYGPHKVARCGTYFHRSRIHRGNDPARRRRKDRHIWNGLADTGSTPNTISVGYVSRRIGQKR